MSQILFANNATSQLNGAVASGAVTAVLAPGTGALFPSPVSGQYFCMTFVDAAEGLLNEIVHVTARSADTITIVRAQEGTTARNWLAGDLASNFLTAGSMQAAIQSYVIASVADLRALPAPTISATFTTASYWVGGTMGGAQYLSVYSASPGTYVENHVTIIVPTGGDGSSAYLLLFSNGLDASQGGAKYGGLANDDSTAWGWLLAIASGRTISCSGQSHIATGQTGTNIVNGKITGTGQFVSGSGSYNLITFSGGNPICTVGVAGQLANQQYTTAVLGSAIDASFPSSGYTYLDLTTTSASAFAANGSASKSGSIVTMALTGDTNQNIVNGIGIQGSPLSLTSGNRYVIFGSTSPTGIATAAPRFIDNTGTEYTPGGGLGGSNFDYLTAVTSIAVKLGTGRFTNTTPLSSISGYTGASYDPSKLVIMQLAGDFATWDFTTSLIPAIIFSGCKNARLVGANFNNLWSCAEFLNCVDSSASGCFVNQCPSGFSATASGSTQVYNVSFVTNTFDGKFQDDTGAWREQVVYRGKAITGSLGNASLNVTATGNIISGMNWGIEYINPSSPVLANNLVMSGNLIDVVFQGISTNATSNLTVQANTMSSTFPWVSGGVEAAINTSNGTKILANNIYFGNSCAKSCTALALYGTDVEIIGNTVKAPVPLSYIGPPEIGAWKVTANNFYYSATGIYFRDVQGEISGANNIRAFGSSVDGSGGGYSPVSMAPIYADFGVEAATQPLIIKGNNMDIGATYALLVNVQNLKIHDNDFANPFGFNPPQSIFGLIWSGASGAIKHSIINNRWDTSPLAFTGSAIAFGQIPAAGGTSIIGRNDTMTSAGAGFTAANSNSYTGTGTVTPVAA